MTADDSLQRFGLVPTDQHLPEIRAILAAEAKAEREGRDREDDLALLCCVQLFSRGLTEDVLRIWDAKSSGFDLGCAIDVQLLCGPGLTPTKEFLSNDTSSSARAALSTIVLCESSGDFEEFTPARQLEQYRRYFRVG